MGKKPAGVLMFLLVILKVLGTIEAACSCTASACDCSSLGLTSVPQDLPTNITNLNLAGNQIITLRLGNLQTLELHYNDITDIPAGTFNSTPQLRDLYLDINRFNFTTLRSDMFTCLGNLEYLHLTSNGITDIQARTFSPTPQLRWLLMQNNKLTTLRSDMFTGLGNLQQLLLQGNDISGIQAGSFSSTSQLRGLGLSNNKLTTLKPGMFTGLGNLQESPLQISVILPSGRNATVELVGRVTVDVNGTIIVRDVTAADAGLYACIAESLVGSTNALLTVDVTYEKPAIVRFERGDNIMVLGETFWMICEASGIPSPDITVILPSGLNVTLDVNSTITITNVTAADAGLYICIAESPVGTAFATLSVDLTYEEPSILWFEKFNSDPLVQGETFHLVCEASGIPTPDITVIFPSGLNATAESRGKMNGDIAIANITTAADAGLYVCVATSPVGSTFATLVIQTVPTTVLTPSVTSPLTTTVNSPESLTDLDSATPSFSPPVFVPSSPPPITVATSSPDLYSTTDQDSAITSPPVSIVSSPLKQPEPAPSFSLAVLLGAVCGSIAGTLLIVAIILAIWCKRNNSQGPPKRPDFSVVFNNTNTTTTVITNGHNLTGQTQPQPIRPPSSQFEPYEDVQPPLRDAVPSQSARGQALPPPNRSNNEPPPVPPPRTASATGYENIPEHAYQPLAVTRNQPDNGQDASHHYQSLRRT
ncbi:Calcium-independent phospholipase A2-gamma [Branchiostoma belcheri]|nr:Calcium-independent phospholipase A2-gamma [Branchiostoma belcheri]